MHVKPASNYAYLAWKAPQVSFNHRARERRPKTVDVIAKTFSRLVYISMKIVSVPFLIILPSLLHTTLATPSGKYLTSNIIILSTENNIFKPWKCQSRQLLVKYCLVN